MVYRVRTIFYSLDQGASIVGSIAKMVVMGLGIYTYVQAIPTVTDKNSPVFYLNFVGIALLAIGEVLYAYRFATSALNISQFIPKDFEHTEAIHFKGIEYFDKGTGQGVGKYFYFFNLVFNGNKGALFGSVLAGIALGLSH